VMTSCAIFTHVYSLIRQITGRSKYSTTAEISKTHIRLRIIIVGLRNLGHCPCPWCLIPMDHVPNIGMPRDMLQHVSLVHVNDVKRRIRVKAACEAIYEHNHRVGGVAVEKLLKEALSGSSSGGWCLFNYAPGVDVLRFQNAFSDKLSLLDFNMFEMLVVDLMHEIEIGVGKVVFIHLLHLLECLHDNLKHELNQR